MWMKVGAMVVSASITLLGIALGIAGYITSERVVLNFGIGSLLLGIFLTYTHFFKQSAKERTETFKNFNSDVDIFGTAEEKEKEEGKKDIRKRG